MTPQRRRTTIDPFHSSFVFHQTRCRLPRRVAQTPRDDGIIRADRHQMGMQRRSPHPPTKPVSTRSTSTTSKTASRVGRWTNPSVIRLLDAAGQTDPIAAITFLVRKAVVDAVDAGWTGPPFDPLRLADFLDLETVPRADVADAQTVPMRNDTARIEFNPNRPHARVRYSIAHEIAHTFFPDCMDQVRERARHTDIVGDAWQLEALCNIGAAEILIPFGSLPPVVGEDRAIERVLDLRQKFEVSTEALLIRVAHLSDLPTAMFCASRLDAGANAGRYRLDYVIGSPTWKATTPKGSLLPEATSLNDCTAIGFTTTGVEAWSPTGESLRVEAVAIPPYPGSRFPRVVGLLRNASSQSADVVEPCIQFVRGDATQVRGEGPRILVQIVNDKTPNWGGGGFAQLVRRTWPTVQEDFIQWAHRDRLALGKVRIADIGDGVSVASIIGQKGYGPSATPRIRYAAVKAGLEVVVAHAKAIDATIHMPRIGTGNAGGSWRIIEDIIRWTCCQAGLSVRVYDLPGSVPAAHESAQASLPI